MSAEDDAAADARHLLALEGPDFLERHDDAWFRRARLRTMERSGVATLSLVGLFWLDWPVEPLAVFVVLGILGGLVADWLKYLFAPVATRDRLWFDLLDQELWRLIDDLRAGRALVRQPANPMFAEPRWQLLVATWLQACLVVSLLYELRTVSSVDLVGLALGSPDMLLAMLGALAVEAVLGAFSLRGLVRDPRPERTLAFAPIVDSILAAMVLFFWMLGSALVASAGGTLLGRDPGGSVVAVLVVAASALQVARGVAEWRWLTRARDAHRWFARRPGAGSPGEDGAPGSAVVDARESSSM
jgi:hypothetical protein